MADRKPVITAGQRTDRPQPRRPEHEPTVWLDYSTGHGVDDNGRTVEPILGGRRKRPRVVDLLETARHHHGRRLMLCGAVPTIPGDWLLPDERTVARGEEHTPGWEDEGHYLEDPPQGRFKHRETRARLAVCLVREWFPEADPAQALTPAQARFSWETLTWVVQKAIERDWSLLRLPSQTILNIWKLRAPESYGMDRLDLEIGQLIQATEPQHRVEHYIASGRCDCGDCPPLVTNSEIPGFAYADGRFMFHGAPPKELGAAPATRLTAEQAVALYSRPKPNEGRFWPARYLVTATVPRGWDTIGLLPVQREHDTGWHWPNRPGATHTSWVDVCELRLLEREGWQFAIHEAIEFTKTNSLGPLSHVVGQMLKLVDELALDGQPASPQLKQVVAGAVRQMFRIGVGAFSRRPRLTTRFAVSINDVPAHAVGPADRLHGGFVYRIPTPTSATDSDTWHPEIAARVWATSRVQVLDGPTATVTRDGLYTGLKRCGALLVPPWELVGITGDAIYTTSVQDWTLPVAQGGGDDGRSGRIRIKGWLPGPLPAPPDITTRQRLSKQAEQNGWRDVL